MFIHEFNLFRHASHMRICFVPSGRVRLCKILLMQYCVYILLFVFLSSSCIWHLYCCSQVTYILDASFVLYGNVWRALKCVLVFFYHVYFVKYFDRPADLHYGFLENRFCKIIKFRQFFIGAFNNGPSRCFAHQLAPRSWSGGVNGCMRLLNPKWHLLSKRCRRVIC